MSCQYSKTRINGKKASALQADSKVYLIFLSDMVNEALQAIICLSHNSSLEFGSDWGLGVSELPIQ